MIHQKGTHGTGLRKFPIFPLLQLQGIHPQHVFRPTPEHFRRRHLLLLGQLLGLGIKLIQQLGLSLNRVSVLQLHCFYIKFYRKDASRPRMTQIAELDEQRQHPDS